MMLLCDQNDLTYCVAFFNARLTNGVCNLVRLFAINHKLKCMKIHLLLSLAVLGLQLSSSAQSGLAPDQNPNYQQSQSRYMALSDSVNQWHSTTFQETYKAYDWYEAKQERKAERQRFRRDLRMERARNSYYQPYGYRNRYPYHSYQYRSYRNPWFSWCF